MDKVATKTEQIKNIHEDNIQRDIRLNSLEEIVQKWQEEIEKTLIKYQFQQIQAEYKSQKEERQVMDMQGRARNLVFKGI